VTGALRKLTLTAHVVCSVGWLGAVIAFLVLAIIGRTSVEPDGVRAMYSR
jgi:putative copper export protein